jgi:GTP cyclohydrolase I
MSHASPDDVQKRAATTRFPTPFLPEVFEKTSDAEKIDKIAFHIRSIMEILGLDLSSDSLKKTPLRVASMYVNEVFSGLHTDRFPSVAMFDNDDDEDDVAASVVGKMVVTRVSFVSLCEHHLVPMIGTAFIGYIPHGKVIGLSKISRITRYFAARPQLQERLSAQIGDSLATLLNHKDVAVLLTATHCCVIARGAKDEMSETKTLYTDGLFEESLDQRQEFLRIINSKGL